MNRSAKGGIGRACTIEAKAFSFAHLHHILFYRMSVMGICNTRDFGRGLGLVRRLFGSWNGLGIAERSFYVWLRQVPYSPHAEERAQPSTN